MDSRYPSWLKKNNKYIFSTLGPDLKTKSVKNEEINWQNRFALNRYF